MAFFAPTGWSKLHDEFKIYAGYFRPAKIQHVEHSKDAHCQALKFVTRTSILQV